MSEPGLTLSAVIPVYCGAGTVGQLVESLGALDISGGHEIILVNDGSPDNSLQVCRQLIATCPVPLTVVQLTRNFGEHNAVMAGLSQARGSWVITMDDDLQNPPSEILRLLEFAQRSGKDAIYAHYIKKQHSIWRNIGSRFANFIAGLVLDKPKGLYLSSFRCLSAFLVRQLVTYKGPFPYIDGLILQTTQNIDHILVKHLPRVQGHSGYTFRRLLRLWTSLFVNFSILPLHISTITGIVFSLFGGLAGIWVVLESFISHTPRGWGSLMVAILLLSGVQLVILGIVGEYLGRIYLTVNNKPQFVIGDIERNSINSKGTTGELDADYAPWRNDNENSRLDHRNLQGQAFPS
jgi:glycosyltransferase involved in cell wall biosynthesis